MANYLDYINQSNQNMRQGLRSAGDGIAEYGKVKERVAEKEAKEEAERVRQERLAEVSGGIPDLEELISNPNSTREDFVNHPSTQRIIQEGIDSGDPNILRSLDPYKDIYDQRYRDQEATAKSKSDKDKEAKKNKIEAKKGKVDEFKVIRGLSEDYADDDTTKRTTLLKESLGKIQSSGKSKTGPGDLSMIFQYMKMLDPGSVVRETEFKAAAESGSMFEYMDSLKEKGLALPSWLMRTGQKIDPGQKGAFLLPNQRRQFLKEAGGLYGAQLDSQQAVEDRYRRDADAIEAPYDRIFTSPVAKEREALKAYQEAMAAEEEKEAAAKEEDGKKVTEVDPDSEGLKQMIEDNTPAFNERVAKADAARSAVGKPPLNEKEKEYLFNKILESKNIKLRGAQ